MGKRGPSSFYRPSVITQRIEDGRSYLKMQVVNRELTQEEKDENDRVMAEHARINNLTVGKLGILKRD